MTDKKAGIKKLNPYILFSAVYVVMIIVAFIPMIVQGKSLIWKIDSLGQYYPAFLYVGKYLRELFIGIFSGNFGIPVFDLSIGMGEDVVGTLNYYGFGDPLNIIAIFATATNGAYVFAVSFYLRLLLGGMAFIYYCRKMGMKTIPSVLGAILWIFSGFSIDGGMRYIEWLSVLTFFPLMMAGAEDILKDRKNHRLLVLSVTYGALCGFYYLYMSSIALGIYCLTRTIFRRGIKECKAWMLDCIGMVPYYIHGIMLAAPIFVPAVKAYLGSERNSSEHAYAYITNYIPHPRLLIGFLKNSIVPSYYINYTMGIALIEWVAIILLFTVRGSSRKMQLQIGVLISLIAASLPITGYLFNGFGETNERWMYLIHFVFIVAFIEMLDENSLEAIIGKIKLRLPMAVVATLLIANVLFNMYYVFTTIGDNWTEEFVPVVEAPAYMQSPYTMSEVIGSDGDLFRVSNDMITEVNGRPENIAMLNNYYGLTYWFSVVNGNMQNYVDTVCGDKMIWRSYGFDNDLNAETLAGCKYYLSRRDFAGIEGHEKNIDSRLVKVDEVTLNGDVWDVYENPKYAGLAYTLSENESVDDAEINDSYTGDIVSSKGITNITYEKSKNRFVIDASFEKGENLVLSVPYSGNWNAYVDGIKISLDKYEMYPLLNIGTGNHSVVVKYCNKAYIVGLIMWIMAIANISVAIIRKRKETFSIK